MRSSSFAVAFLAAAGLGLLGGAVAHADEDSLVLYTASSDSNEASTGNSSESAVAVFFSSY